MNTYHDHTLRIRLYHRDYDRRLVTIHVNETGYDSAGRTCIRIEVRHGGKVIFPMGQLYGACHGGTTAVKELAMTLASMRPGDTDDTYFHDCGYTDAQRAWATKHGESLSCEREARYCDENGSLKERD